MTKNSLESKKGEGKREATASGLTRAGELLEESNLLAEHARVTGFRSLQALAELRALDAFDELELESYAAVPAPARGDLVALALTLEALEALRRGSS
jgi:hypothetical protein